MTPAKIPLAAELNRVVAIALRCLSLNHDARAGFEDCQRNDEPVLPELLRHT